MTKEQDKLLQLRSKIDAIDNGLIELLNQRIKVIEEVGIYKKSINEKFFIKSAREADMIKSLVARADKSIPKSTIVNIWRKIITSANVLEQNLHITIHNPDKIADYQYLIREYYGDFVPLSFYESASYIITQIEKEKYQIGIFAIENNSQNNTEHWWINLANNQSGIKIFAKIPFVGESQHQLFAAAIKPAEKSNDDQTLLCVEIGDKYSKQQVEEALLATGSGFKILKSDKLEQVQNITFYLIEIDGFFEEKSPEIIKFSKNEIKPFIKIIGHFANPIN